jgi:hypothetical protein
MVNMHSNTLNGEQSPAKWLYALLALTLALVAWTAFHENTVQSDLIDDQPQQESSSNRRNNQLNQAKKVSSVLFDVENLDASQPVSLNAIKHQSAEQDIHDVFKVHSWAPVAVPKKEIPTVPPAPEAPPVPFNYVGKLEDSPKGTQLFLMANNKLYTVLVGSDIDQEWRLDSEDVNTLTFTYLPLNLTQNLSKAAKPPEPATAEVNQ